MSRILRPEEITGPFAGLFLDNLYAYGPLYDQGAIASSGTITTQRTPVNDGDSDVYGCVVVTNSGNVTGIIVQAPLYINQKLCIVNGGSGTLAFAAVSTSNVLQGVTGTVTVNKAIHLFSVKTASINSGALTWVST